jgi:hypothetical protein
MNEILKIPMTLEQTCSQVFKRYYAFKDTHNEVQEGNKTWLKKGHKGMFEVIMYKYIPMFRQLINTPTWADSEALPSMEITRKELARLCHCSTRNTYDIIARLSWANVLEVEEFNSKDNGYLITPNLWLLLGGDIEKPKVKKLFETPTTIRRSTVRQFLPTIKPFEILNNKNKAELPSFPHHERHHEIYLEKKQIETPDAKNQILGKNNFLENLGGGAENDDVDNSTDKLVILTNTQKLKNRLYGTAKQNPLPIKAGEPTISEREKNQIISDFWNYAHKALFPLYSYDGNTVESFKKLIRSDVFSSFNEHKDYFYWRTFYLMRCSEVDLIKAHNDKYDREAFFPLAFFSKKYADRSGFLEAHKWTRKEKKKFDEVRQKDLLQKAQTSLIMNLPPRHLKNKNITLTELTQYWGNRLGRVTSPEIVKQYYHFLSTTNLTRAWN